MTVIRLVILTLLVALALWGGLSWLDGHFCPPNGALTGVCQ